jgi:endothelin-converting enzyme/putative endopeptidase
MKRIVGSSVVAALAVLAWQPAATRAEPPKAEIGEWGIDATGLSKAVRPGDDFYRYVNEGWLKTAKNFVVIMKDGRIYKNTLGAIP